MQKGRDNRDRYGCRDDDGDSLIHRSIVAGIRWTLPAVTIAR